MTTAIRRATAPDVVNLYRLVSKQDDFSLFGQPDEARAIAFVLDLIARGYVVVAEHSGRLVASIGFAAHQPPLSPKTVLDCEWFYVVPKYRDSGVGAQMLDQAIQAADEYSAPIRLMLPAVTPLEDALIDAGFVSGRTEWIRPGQKADEPEYPPDEEPAAE